MKIRNLFLGAIAISAFAAPAMAMDMRPPHGGAIGGRFDTIDANHDGVITREEARAAHAAVFNQIDTNHDGFLTRDEMRTHHRAQMQGMRDKMRTNHSEMIDKDKDGKISRNEWTSAPEEMRVQREQMRAQMFDRLDTNRDGFLSDAEMRAGRPQAQNNAGANGQNRPQRPQNPDTNRDGKISRAEWNAMEMPMFDRGDLNRDGRITREEANQAMHDMHRNRGGHDGNRRNMPGRRN